MIIRRVDLRDFFIEPNTASPTTNFTNTSIVGAGVFSIAAEVLDYTRNAGGDAAMAYWTAGFTQSEKLLYGVKITVNAVAAGWAAGLIIQGSAAAGQYLGNSRVLNIDADNTTLFPSAANVLGVALSETAHVHGAGNDYRLLLSYDPSTGDYEIFEDDNLSDDRPDAVTSLDSGIDPVPLTGNGQLGVYCVDCDCDFEFFRVCRPPINEILDETVYWHHFLSKRPSMFTIGVGLDDDLSTPELAEGDLIEILIYDGSDHWLELYAQVEVAKPSTSRGRIHYAGRDVSSQLLKNQGKYVTGGAVALSVHITGLISANTDLPVEDVKGGGGNYDVGYQGRPLINSIEGLCNELGYMWWYTPQGRLNITDTFAASGITIDNADGNVLDVEQTKDLYDVCNIVDVYYTGGDEEREDAASQAAYGKRGGAQAGGVMYDENIAAAPRAQAVGDFWKDNYKDPVKAVRINVSDYHELNVGETVTLELDNLGITGQSALVVEKSYNSKYPWLTFVCVLYAGAPVLRLPRDPVQTGSQAWWKAADAIGWQTQ